MKGKLYKSVKSREEIESSQLFSTMLQKVDGTNSVVIDGKNLMADSIYAKHIQSKQITTDHLVVGVATADLINTGGLKITDELKVVHGDKDVLFINSDGALEMNISALKIGLVDFEKDINTEIKAIAGSWSQLNLNNAGDIISGINANAKGTNIHGKNISLTGDTDVQGDFRVTGGQVVLNANTDVRGDFKVSGGNVVLNANTDIRGDFTVSGGNVVLDANTDIRGDFTVSGNKVVLDAETTVLDTFTVKGDMLASNLDVEQLTIRAKNGLQNVLHIDSTGRVELNVDAFHIKALDVEQEIAKRATKEELANIELTPGPPGPEGQATYTHVGYATGPNGENFSPKTFENATYVGIYVGESKIPPTPVTRYEWTLIKGQNGNNGSPGPRGPQGLRTYLHTAWTNDPDNTNNSTSGFSRTVSENKLYIGTYTDTEEGSANNPGPYKWVKVKGEEGPQGPKGDTGSKGDRGAAGRSIKDVIVEYAVSSSPTAEPAESSFSPTTPQWSSGQYIWSHTRTTYEDNSADSVSKAAVITGGEGPQGPGGSRGPQGTAGSKGDAGQSVDNIRQEFAVTTSKTIVPGEHLFKRTRDPWSKGKYVWTRSYITYKNPIAYETTTPVVSTEWEAVNDVEAKINNAVTTIDGTGVTVKDGSFFLEDDSSSEKYSLKIRTNLITDHGIEFLIPTTMANIGGGATFNLSRERYSGSDSNVYSYLPRGTIDIMVVGAPYLYISYLPNELINADYTPIFGATSGIVNNTNYFEAKVSSRISRNTTYTFSAHFKKHPNMTGSFPRLEVYQRRRLSSTEHRLASESFSYTSSNTDTIRYSVTFTTNNLYSTDNYFLRLRVNSTNSNYVMVDGLQLVEGDNPVQYHAEDTATFHQRDTRAEINGLSFDVRQLQNNKPVHSQGTSSQGKWVRFDDGMAIVEFYIRTIPNNTWVTWGSMWYVYLEYHWDFPIYFQNPPNVTGSFANYAGFISPNKVTKDRASSIGVYRPANTNSMSGEWVYLTAIGRWKN